MKTQWKQFLDDLDDYLYDHGWYCQGRRIKDRNFTEGDYQSVIDYLTCHCYEKQDAVFIVYKLTNGFLNEDDKINNKSDEFDYWDGRYHFDN